MMNTIHLMSRLFLSALLMVSALASEKVNFNGQWVTDKTKAEAIPSDMEQRMKVEQDGDSIRIETDLFQGDNVQTVPDHYTVDGKEVEIIARLQSGDETKAKRTAKWNEKGDGFEVRDIAVFNTADGIATITTVRTWVMGADGKSLVIEIKRTAPDGVITTKRLFTRK